MRSAQLHALARCCSASTPPRAIAPQTRAGIHATDPALTPLAASDLARGRRRGSPATHPPRAAWCQIPRFGTASRDARLACDYGSAAFCPDGIQRPSRRAAGSVPLPAVVLCVSGVTHSVQLLCRGGRLLAVLGEGTDPIQ